ncbi:hypothetical protein [Pararhizobium haloflavum]|uniref:hypothetical protein n=1 Tax=Pararhizobium haloflavum TaxID=2037914 RepID=UPI000C1A736C|nr:hypothetical protein [Pararhizobium haloflavum]
MRFFVGELTASSLDGRRLQRLQRVLAQVTTDIEREIGRIGRQRARAASRAGFAMQALENDDGRAGLQSAVDVMEERMCAGERRSAELALQARFLADLQLSLPVVFRDGRQATSHSKAATGHAAVSRFPSGPMPIG